MEPQSGTQQISGGAPDQAKEEITRLLGGPELEAPQTAEALMSVLYRELHQLAAAKMAREAPGHTLQATALVHEAWMRLVSSEQQTWQNRGHFFGAAAEAMRRILVENARRKQRVKRGGGWERVDWDSVQVAGLEPDERILAVNDALAELAKVGPLEAEVVKLRFFAGLEYSEIAGVLRLSERTVHRYWAFAKVWLFEWLRGEGARQRP